MLRLVVIVLAVGAFVLAVPAAASASSAVLVADTRAAQLVGARGITPDATRPAEESLRGGRVVVTFPVARRGGSVRLGGGFSFRRGGVRVEFRALRLSGARVVGRYGGRSYSVLVLRGVRRSGRVVRHGSGTLGGDAAALLRRRFGSPVFRGGLRFFLSGRIPTR